MNCSRYVFTTLSDMLYLISVIGGTGTTKAEEAEEKVGREEQRER